MNENLLKNLKELRQIQPDSDYANQSRFLILASPRNSEQTFHPTFSYKLTFTMGLISVFVLMALGGVYYINKPNQNNFVVRANELNGSIQVKLNEIKYLVESGQYIDAENIRNIQILLEKTTDELKEASILSQNDNDLEKSLEKIMSAKETLLQISAMLK